MPRRGHDHEHHTSRRLPIPHTLPPTAKCENTGVSGSPCCVCQLLATYPQLGERSLLGPGAPKDPMARLEAITQEFTRLVLKYEPELRAQLHLALKPGPREPDGLPLRQGRGIGWIEEALIPLHTVIAERDRHRLVLTIRATIGIEALVWLTDVAGVSPEARKPGHHARVGPDPTVIRNR